MDDYEVQPTTATIQSIIDYARHIVGDCNVLDTNGCAIISIRGTFIIISKDSAGFRFSNSEPEKDIDKLWELYAKCKICNGMNTGWKQYHTFLDVLKSSVSVTDSELMEYAESYLEKEGNEIGSIKEQIKADPISYTDFKLPPCHLVGPWIRLYAKSLL